MIMLNTCEPDICHQAMDFSFFHFWLIFIINIDSKVVKKTINIVLEEFPIITELYIRKMWKDSNCSNYEH